MGIKINYTGKGFIHPITKQYIAPGYGFEDFSILDIENCDENKKIDNIENIAVNIDNQTVLNENLENINKTTKNLQNSDTNNKTITKKVKKVKKNQ